MFYKLKTDDVDDGVGLFFGNVGMIFGHRGQGKKTAPAFFIFAFAYFIFAFTFWVYDF